MGATTVTNFDWLALPDDYAARYANLNARYANIYSVSAARLVELARVQAGSTVIDLGAGIGLSTLAALQAVGERGRVLAIDPSRTMLTYARRKAGLGAAEFVEGGAAELLEVAAKASIGGRTDSVISSFTYYYTYESRNELHAQVRQVLKHGGRWSFNLTRYLGLLKINGRTYNEYSSAYLEHLQRVAHRHGVQLSANGHASEQFASTDWELEALRQAGFKDVAVEAWPLPLTPSEANRFTLEGFFRYGSRTTFAPELMELPPDKRLAILEETLANCAEDIDAMEVPHIANFIAAKP